MTALVWDKVGERRYETGIDRGVLYLPNGVAVPWNGLTGLTENRTREVKSFYTDGVKYLDHYSAGDFAANLTAFTYPDELEPLLGDSEYLPGVSVYDQRPQMFNLTYRTQIGNDLDPDAGYKIHILWNLLAVPADAQFSSGGADVSPVPFSWSLTATPSQMFGARPTAHISLNSLRMNATALAAVEAVLYGTDGTEDVDPTDPMLPTLVDLLTFISDTVTAVEV
jgi:hypothetical protein